MLGGNKTLSVAEGCYGTNLCFSLVRNKKYNSRNLRADGSYELG